MLWVKARLPGLACCSPCCWIFILNCLLDIRLGKSSEHVDGPSLFEPMPGLGERGDDEGA